MKIFLAVVITLIGVILSYPLTILVIAFQQSLIHTETIRNILLPTTKKRDF